MVAFLLNSSLIRYFHTLLKNKTTFLTRWRDDRSLAMKLKNEWCFSTIKYFRKIKMSNTFLLLFGLKQHGLCFSSHDFRVRKQCTIETKKTKRFSSVCLSFSARLNESLISSSSNLRRDGVHVATAVSPKTIRTHACFFQQTSTHPFHHWDRAVRKRNGIVCRVFLSYKQYLHKLQEYASRKFAEITVTLDWMECHAHKDYFTAQR